MRRANGFTLIEVVIAIAITTLLVAAVYAATQSMTGLAQRQKAAAAEDSRREAFQRILRRDLRGWLAPKTQSSAAAGNQPSAGGQALLRFSTSADGLSSGVVDGALAQQSRAVANVEYAMQSGPFGFDVIRSESNSAGNPPLVLALMRFAVSPRIEYFDGAKWNSQWNSPERPKAIRIIAGEQEIVAGI